ncbi:hypothetical protein CE91St41_18320 [Oscillospiraceae bacterium]|nr:hypothetical protein CE91St40_19200 [Oscillospiraceae bacterium]BDF74943.1 hypothetical protein CE91St41_18320 [Oscillospiraceae bacterium]
MPSWLTKKNLEVAAGCAGAVAVLLFPASLITLGIGAALGYKGRSWIKENIVDNISQIGGEVIR